jgi:hypothetical protein
MAERKRAVAAVERAKLQALNGFFTDEQIRELEQLLERVEVDQ